MFRNFFCRLRASGDVAAADGVKWRVAALASLAGFCRVPAFQDQAPVNILEELLPILKDTPNCTRVFVMV
eukprot:1177031-Prorocentrum_minimum.AAC.1